MSAAVPNLTLTRMPSRTARSTGSKPITEAISRSGSVYLVVGAALGVGGASMDHRIRDRHRVKMTGLLVCGIVAAAAEALLVLVKFLGG